MQLLQHFDGQLKLPAVAAAAPRHACKQTRQVSRNDGPHQHNDPGDIDPDQQNRQGGKSPVNHGIGRHVAQVKAEYFFGHFNACGHKHTARPGVGPFHIGVGHVVVKRCEAARYQKELKHIEQKTQTDRHAAHQAAGG